MQLPQVTSQYGMLGFQLPFLHREIPISAMVRRRESKMSQFASALVEVGVINPRSIPDDAATAMDVVAAGLSDWFNKRAGSLKHIKFTPSILGVDEVMGYYEASENIGAEDKENIIKVGTPFLALNSPDFEEPYKMQEAVDLCEKYQPGLFRWVLEAISSASYRTVDIRLPFELYNEFAMYHYDCDWSEKVTDKMVMESLVERLGSEEEAKQYLPSRVMPIFGFEHWAHSKRKKLSKRGFYEFVRNGRPGKARTIAREAATLLELHSKVLKADVKLPDLCDVGLYRLKSSCCLVFQSDTIVWDTLDTQIEMAMQGGDYTELLGLQQLPADRQGLKKYFQNLDQALELTRQLDKVISLVSTSVNP